MKSTKASIIDLDDATIVPFVMSTYPKQKERLTSMGWVISNTKK